MTSRIQLIQLDEATERALEKHPQYLAALSKADWGQLADVVQQVVGPSLEMLFARDAQLHWGGYVVADVTTRRAIGSCAFKTAPNENGIVEIAYFTYPEYEGQGYATRMAAELIALALSSDEVAGLIAHTLPEKNASTRVLEKNGMQLVGEVHDPEDGLVWRWEYVPPAE